jgi:hypothetical protein
LGTKETGSKDDLGMKGSHLKGVNENISFRMKVGVILMLLAILLPSTILTLPVSKILVTVVNADGRPIHNVRVYLGGYSDEYFSVDSLQQGYERSGSFHVRPGTHLIRIIYDCEVAEYSYYPNEVWGSYTLLPFETQDKEFDLRFPL